MKRGTPRHPKIQHLCELLKIKLATAVGYLELLWHFAAEFAPQGDIGRFSDERIEGGIHWSGPSGKLISALIESGWIDAVPVHRLVVHHWEDHADDAVRKRLNRGGLSFLPVREKVTGHRQTSADNGSLPEPSPACAPPLPEPGPEPGPFDSRPDSRKNSANSGQLTQEWPQTQTQTQTQTQNDGSKRRKQLSKAMTRMTGRVPPDDDLDGVLAVLGDSDSAVDGFDSYLRRLPAKFQFGGRNAPKKNPWFISVARTYMRTEILQSPTESRCRHGKEYGSCCNPPGGACGVALLQSDNRTLTLHLE
jgi:hypothetical protein